MSMSNKWDNRFHSVRWSLFLAFLRTATAALVVFIGIAWGGLSLWEVLPDSTLAPLTAQLTASQWGIIFGILIFSAVVTVLLVGVRSGFVESRALKRRMRTLIEATMSWANGGLGHRIVVQGEEDELTELALSLNGMAERLEEHVAALQRLIEKNEELHQQAAGLAKMEERSRLARDLHDSVSQQLFALGMTAGAASKLIEVAPERAKPLVVQTEEMAAKAQAEMRALLLHLRPVELEGRSLVEAAERFLQDVCPRNGLRYEFDVDVATRLGEGIESHLFRIIQESVSNVVRHASATTLRLRLVQERASIVLSILDDGQGFDPQLVRDGSYGAHSIRERAEEIGGVLEVRSSRGNGTEVRVTVRMIGRGEGVAR
jgi:two-component system, NarL family, sensor histidine kinase LiaS